MSEFLDLDKIPIQKVFGSYGNYSKDFTKTLRQSALMPALYLGDYQESYHAIDYTGIHNVDAKLYSNRVSPLKGWKGQGAPENDIGEPTEGNPLINYLMDFSTAELYTYGNVITPGSIHTRSPEWPSYCTTRWRVEMLKKDFVYEGAPVKGYIFRGQYPDNTLDLLEYSDPAEGGDGREDVLYGYPDYTREFNRWGKDTVTENLPVNHVEIDNDRPVRGWPLRIQRIPLCVDSSNILRPLGGNTYGSNGDPCAGAGGEQLKGYFYTLATDPVLFTEDDPCKPEYWNGVEHQWISQEGLLPLSTNCGGGTSFSINGYDCSGKSIMEEECEFAEWDPSKDYEVGNDVSYNGICYCATEDSVGQVPSDGIYWKGHPVTGSGCYPIECLNFESGDFCIETGASGECAGTANVYWAGIKASAPTGCSGDGFIEIPHVKEFRFGSGLNFSDYVSGDCCSGGYVEISAISSLSISGDSECCYECDLDVPEWYDDPEDNFHMWEAGAVVKADGKCYRALQDNFSNDANFPPHSPENWEEVTSDNSNYYPNITNIQLGNGLTANGGSSDGCEGTVTISACTTAIQGTGCHGSGMIDLGILNVGSGLCVDIDSGNCQATLYSQSTPLSVSGIGQCCGEEAQDESFSSVNQLNFGSGFKVVGGSDGKGGDCCTEGEQGHVTIEACPINIFGSGCEGEFSQELANLRVGSGLCLEQVDECTSEITALNFSLNIQAGYSCCETGQGDNQYEEWVPWTAYEEGDKVLSTDGKCYENISYYAGEFSPQWTIENGDLYWEETECQAGFEPNGESFENVTNIILGSGLNAHGQGGSEGDCCEAGVGGSVTIEACLPTISGSGCEGEISGNLVNLEIGSGLCLDQIDECTVALSSTHGTSTPFSVSGSGGCCDDYYNESSYFSSVNRINFGDGFKITEGEEGHGGVAGDCCEEGGGAGGGYVTVETCPLTIEGSGCDEEIVSELYHLQLGEGLCLEQIDECTTRVTVPAVALNVSGSGECCGEEGSVLVQSSVGELVFGSGFMLSSDGGGSEGDCCNEGEGASVTINACSPTISGSGCLGGISSELVNLQIGSGLCVDQIDECTTLLSSPSIPLTIEGGETCCDDTTEDEYPDWDPGVDYLGGEYIKYTWTQAGPKLGTTACYRALEDSIASPPDGGGGDEFWEEVDCSSSPDPVSMGGVSKIILGSGLKMEGGSAGSEGDCCNEGSAGEVTISACTPIVSGIDCEGNSISSSLTNLGIGSGLCLDIIGDCEAQISSASHPLRISGSGACCGEEGGDVEFGAVGSIGFGSGFRIIGEGGTEGDCCNEGEPGNVTIESCVLPLTVAGGDCDDCGGSDSYDEWNGGETYGLGDKVEHNGNCYEWNTFAEGNNEPPSFDWDVISCQGESNQYSNVSRINFGEGLKLEGGGGECSSEITVSACNTSGAFSVTGPSECDDGGGGVDCEGSTPWSASQGYLYGSKVTYGGKCWIADSETVAGEVPGVAWQWSEVAPAGGGGGGGETVTSTGISNIVLGSGLALSSYTDGDCNGGGSVVISACIEDGSGCPAVTGLVADEGGSVNVGDECGELSLIGIGNITTIAVDGGIQISGSGGEGEGCPAVTGLVADEGGSASVGDECGELSLIGIGGIKTTAVEGGIEISGSEGGNCITSVGGYTITDQCPVSITFEGNICDTTCLTVANPSNGNIEVSVEITKEMLEECLSLEECCIEYLDHDGYPQSMKVYTPGGCYGCDE